MAGQLLSIPGIKRHRQQQQRKNSDSMRWREVMEGKEKAGDAGEHRAAEENGGPAIESPRGEQACQHDKAGKDSDQADNDVDDGEDGQAKDHCRTFQLKPRKTTYLRRSVC